MDETARRSTAETDFDAAPPFTLPTSVVLEVIGGPDAGLKVELQRGVYRVGKLRDCEIQLTDTRVSRMHLSFTVNEDAVVVRDLGSRNGSFLQGARFSELTVGIGAVIRIGRSDLKLSVPVTARADQQLDGMAGLRGRSAPMQKLYAQLKIAAQTDAPILLFGETGTGKELCADAIHRASARAAAPLVVCDFGAMSRSIMESELFGHVRGAFTGADRDRPGLFEQAHHGTAFLDEIGELAIESQPRLLRVLERHTVRRVGSSRYLNVDVRIIAATHRNLRAEIEAERFREDLFHRLSVITIRVPPLRERPEDIACLVQHFLHGRPLEVPTETLELLQSYDWPGNVRELQNVVERGAAAAMESGVLSPQTLGLASAKQPIGAAPSPAEKPLDGFKEEKERILAAWEREYLQTLLERAQGNISQAARISGLDRAYLHRLLNKHQIRPG